MLCCAAPFTFDGFGFGFGGLFPAQGAFNNFALQVYNVLIRDIFNSGLNEYVARSISNNPINPLDVVSPEIGDRLGRDVVSFFGYDFWDRLIERYYTPASASLGELVDAGCAGPTYGVTVNGYDCEIMDDGTVECTKPTVTLQSTPLTCNLPYRSAASLEGASWTYEQVFGLERNGEIGPPADVYSFGAAVNVTVPYLGYSANLQKLLNDFGVQQWYQFLGNLVLNELLRIQAALLDGEVDSALLTARAAAIADADTDDTADRSGSSIADDSTGGTAGHESGIISGIQALTSAGSNLLDKIAIRMGISTDDLKSGLTAAGVLPKPQATTIKQGIPQQPQQQLSAAGARSGSKPAQTATGAAGTANTGATKTTAPNATERSAAPQQPTNDTQHPAPHVTSSQLVEGDPELIQGLTNSIKESKQKAARSSTIVIPKPTRSAPKQG
eukprot:GHRR01004468.1.p1 GENE.GHRR01004468.1~~GHRR01004468.1.p1  ORF type:complete len:443 (+),score=94.05 GHRR01004468.1:532-1860(+)